MADVKVTKEGIQFGKCFISHEAILDGRGPIVKDNYAEWLGEALKPCPHKIGTGPEGHDICVHCMKFWEDRDTA